MTITACPKCGSRKIFQGKLKEGILTGYTPTKYVCRNCGYQGAPLIFDSGDEYKKFAIQIDSKNDENDEEQFSENDKKIMEHIKEISKEKDENYDEEGKILKNITSKLGICLIIAGILIISVTRGIYLYQVGTIIFDGIILLVIGLIIENKNNLKINKYPKISGIIYIISGAIFLVIFLLMIYFAMNMNLFITPGEPRAYLLGMQDFILSISVILIAFSIIEIIGGVFSILKKNWGIVIIAGIIGTIIFPPYSIIPSLIALILVSFSKEAFKSEKSIL